MELGKSHRALFYPIYFNRNGEITDVGDALPEGVGVESIESTEDRIAVWPTPRPDGEDGRWSVVPDTLRDLMSKGAVRVGKVDIDKGQFPIFYLTSNQLKKIEKGELEVKGYTSSGTMKVFYREDSGRVSAPKTVWNKVSHSASEHGSTLLRLFLPNRKFPFPKSLYAVEDILRLFVKSKPNATVLDFFSGSGTTAHAIMRLNRQDEGMRQCISITNNEVASDEQAALRRQGLRPSDTEWEVLGICNHITKPRIKAAITGNIPDGDPIKGDYKFTDEFPMSEGFAENAEFFTLTYETPETISYNLAFQRIAPLLWMRAGSQGSRINKLPENGWAVADTYGLLTDLDQASPFCEAVAKQPNIRIAYIVTDDDRPFQSIARRLPDSVEPVRLYESYLSNFRFTNGE